MTLYELDLKGLEYENLSVADGDDSYIVAVEADTKEEAVQRLSNLLIARESDIDDDYTDVFLIGRDIKG